MDSHWLEDDRLKICSRCHATGLVEYVHSANLFGCYVEQTCCKVRGYQVKVVEGTGGFGHGTETLHRAFQLDHERGVSTAQAASDLHVHENVLRKWVMEIAADPQYAVPSQVR